MARTRTPVGGGGRGVGRIVALRALSAVGGREKHGGWGWPFAVDPPSCIGGICPRGASDRVTRWRLSGGSVRACTCGRSAAPGTLAHAGRARTAKPAPDGSSRVGLQSAFIPAAAAAVGAAPSGERRRAGTLRAEVLSHRRNLERTGRAVMPGATETVPGFKAQLCL